MKSRASILKQAARRERERERERVVLHSVARKPVESNGNGAEILSSLRYLGIKFVVVGGSKEVS